MKTQLLAFSLMIATASSGVAGAEPLDVSGSYQRIVADYQLIAAAANSSAAHAAAGRLTRDAYRNLIHQADGAEKLSADDLYALGACHEAIGDTDEAKILFSKSLASAPGSPHASCPGAS